MVLNPFHETESVHVNRDEGKQQQQKQQQQRGGEKDAWEKRLACAGMFCIF